MTRAPAPRNLGAQHPLAAAESRMRSPGRGSSRAQNLDTECPDHSVKVVEIRL